LVVCGVEEDEEKEEEMATVSQEVGPPPAKKQAEVRLQQQQQQEKQLSTTGRGVAKLNETDGGRQRFILELEFVQLLANPTYIHCVFSLLPSLAFFFQLLCNFCILLAVQIIYPALSA
jgi:hypothetical protein